MTIRHRAARRIGGTVAAVAALALSLVLGHAATSAAHEVPADVTVQAFVRPEGETLRLLVRVPLEALRDVRFPRRGPGYLDIPRAGPALRHAAEVWIVEGLEVYEDGERLADPRLDAVRVSLPSDRSFGDYEEALAHVNGPPLPADTELYGQQGLLDLLLEYPIASERSQFSIDPALGRLGMRTTTVLRFLTPDGAERVFQYVGDPGLVRLDPRWHQAALRFVSLGFFHILDGVDHLLFLLCLVVPIRRFRPLVAVVTSFTVAHSITLIASVLGLAPTALWFPPLIESLIAASIVYMALENVLGPRLRHRWLITFGFGLVHGFGFSFALRETLQFAGGHLVSSLLSFNVGVELGQLAVLAVAVPTLNALFRHAVPERTGAIVISVLLGHHAWHWMTDRAADLTQYRFAWPALDLLLLASAMRWAMVALIVGGAAWALFALFGRDEEAGTEVRGRTVLEEALE